WPKFPTLFSLYIAQSIPMSFFSTVVPVIMRQENYSLESIGLMQLVKLPWIVKFMWAPLVDRTSGSTRNLKKWIFLSEIFYAFVIILTGMLSLQTDFKLIVVLMLAAFTASATQDIATDSYAIRLLLPSERSLGNSMQSAGSFIGTLFGTGVLLIAYHYFGWQALLSILACFVVFALLPVILYRKNVDTPHDIKKRVSWLDIIRFFKIPGMHKRVLLLTFYYSGIIGILAMLKPWMVDLGYSVRQIGTMSGIAGTSIAALSAMAAGWIINKAGRRTSLFAFLGVTLITGIYFRIIAAGVPSTPLLFAGICLLWGGYGLSTVAIYTTSMDLVRKGREGTDFTIQIVITHLSSLIMAVISGQIAGKTSYQ
ncbi:MAG: MFS transporter, partial [Bacteroidales bacterium]|nr:MFS transporter [Bacteroidales bacterium]